MSTFPDSPPVPWMQLFQTNTISVPPSAPDEFASDASTQGQSNYYKGFRTEALPQGHRSHQLPSFRGPPSYVYGLQGYHTMVGTPLHFYIHTVA